jgi:hypothetical protein
MLINSKGFDLGQQHLNLMRHDKLDQAEDHNGYGRRLVADYFADNNGCRFSR